MIVSLGKYSAPTRLSIGTAFRASMTASEIVLATVMNALGGKASCR